MQTATPDPSLPRSCPEILFENPPQKASGLVHGPEKAMAAGVDSTSRVCVDHVFSPRSSCVPQDHTTEDSVNGSEEREPRGLDYATLLLVTDVRCPSRLRRDHIERKTKKASTTVHAWVSDYQTENESADLPCLYLFLSLYLDGNLGETVILIICATK